MLFWKSNPFFFSFFLPSTSTPDCCRGCVHPLCSAHTLTSQQLALRSPFLLSELSAPGSQGSYKIDFYSPCLQNEVSHVSPSCFKHLAKGFPYITDGDGQHLPRAHFPLSHKSARLGGPGAIASSFQVLGGSQEVEFVPATGATHFPVCAHIPKVLTCLPSCCFVSEDGTS